MSSLMVFAGAEASTPVLSGVVTAAMLNGVFNEIVGLLPVIVPVSVGFIAIRKGLGFLFSSLRAASVSYTQLKLPTKLEV